MFPKSRSCTDIPCCILFAVFVIVFICIGIYAFAMGDPRYLIYPMDSNGTLCGVGRNENKKFLLYFNLIECVVGTGALSATTDFKNFQFKFCPTPQVCVTDCPKYYWTPITSDPNEAVCKGDVKPKDTLDAVTMVRNEECAPFLFPSEPAPLRSAALSTRINANTGKKEGFQASTELDRREGKKLLAKKQGDTIPSMIGKVNNETVVYRCLPSFAVFENTTFPFSGTDLADKNKKTITVNQLEQAIKNLTKELNVVEDYGIKILGDVTASWWLILIFVTIAMVLSFLWIVLMRWLAGVIVWLSIILFAVFFAFGIYCCFNKYLYLKNTTSNWIVTQDLSYYTNLKETWLALGIIAAIVLGITLLLLLFLINRLRIAIALIKEGSRAIGYMIFTLFWPLVPYLLQMIVLAYWGASAICLAAISKTNRTYCQFSQNETQFGNITETQEEAQYSNVRCWFNNQFNSIKCGASTDGLAGSICQCFTTGDCDVRYTYVLQAFQLFVWFWLMNFIIAIGQVTLAGAFASYYWASSKPADIPMFPVTSALGRALRYHMGSMAFGALLIAIVQIITAILTYLDHKLKGRENMVAKFILKCLICCFYCLEKLLKFINKNAYIMIAVYGKNFCTSAKNAFSLLLRNLIRVVVIDKVADFLLFLSKLFITGAIGVLAYFFFAREIPGIDKVLPKLQLNYYLIPVLIIICATYIVATAFFSVYDMAIDTLFLCFLEDLERHDGSAAKPYYMNKELMNILGKKNKIPKQS